MYGNYRYDEDTAENRRIEAERHLRNKGFVKKGNDRYEPKNGVLSGAYIDRDGRIHYDM